MLSTFLSWCYRHVTQILTFFATAMMNVKMFILTILIFIDICACRNFSRVLSFESAFYEFAWIVERKFWRFDFERFPYPLKIFHCKHDKSIKFYVQSIEIIYAWDDGYMHQLLWILTSECNNFLMMPKHKSMLLTLRFTFMIKHLWRHFHLN